MADTVNFQGDDFISMEDMEDVRAWDGSSDPVAPGAYLVAVDSVEKGDSKAGNPQIKVTFKIASKADGTSTGEEGRTLRNYYQLTGKGRSRLKAFLQAVKEYDPTTGGFSVSKLAGKKLAVTVAHESAKWLDKITMEEKTGVNCRVGGERAVG